MTEKGSKKRLGDILVDQGVITRQQLERAVMEQNSTGKRIGDFLVDMGFVRPEALLRALGRQYGLQYRNVKEETITPEAKSLLPEEFIKLHRVLPLRLEKGTIHVAIPNTDMLDDLQQYATENKIEYHAYLGLPRDIDERIQAMFPPSASQKPFDDFLDGIETDELEQVKDVEDALTEEQLRADAEEAPAVVLVNRIIAHGISAQASDIHIEPKANEVQLRYRLDGVMKPMKPIPKKFQNHVISRCKILADMDISERRLPQDGRFKMQTGNRVVDFRVSAMPTIHGEKIVIRLLDKSRMPPGLEGLGLESDGYETMKRICHRPNGMVLVTGPTGSGKSTTLYSFLKEVARPDVNVITVEDPVELENPCLNQVHIREDIGLTFAETLRTILRQDPDIVMVGEIRDLETVEIAIRTALTGHLLFSTLHTNDAPSSIMRLLDMGVKPFLISASLVAIIAQRLLRKICEKCKSEYLPDVAVLDALGLEGEARKGPFYRGTGCEACTDTGYKGRTGIFEVLEVTEGVRRTIVAEPSIEMIRGRAVAEGMVTLRGNALKKMFQGVTTPEEVMNVTYEEI